MCACACVPLRHHVLYFNLFFVHFYFIVLLFCNFVVTCLLFIFFNVNIFFVQAVRQIPVRALLSPL